MALLSISYSASNAQQIDATSQVTGNVITSNWQGTVPGASYGGYSGGYQPGYVSGDRAIVFGYNQGTASQSVGIAAALNAGGAPVELKGYTYSWYYYNNDMNRGSLTGNISLVGSTGNTLESYNYTMPQTGVGNWIQQSGSQLFTNQYQINQVSNLNVSFTGKDDRWWAGYYGPAIKSVDVRLMYGVNPCATNPAYSVDCAGFSSVVDSTNLVPNPDAYGVFGNGVNNSFAINQAMSAAGTGVSIHGFKWGYVANANGPYCNSWDMGWFGCWDFRTPSVSTHVSITDQAGANLYSVDRTYTNSYNTTNYSYLFPASRPLNTLGNFNFTATTNDVAYVGSMWSKAIYTPDPCTVNPLSSPTCPGYLKALGVNTSPTTDTATQTTTTATIDSAAQPATTTTIVEPATTASTTGSTSGTSSVSSGSTTADVAQPIATSTSTSTASSTSPTSTTSLTSATSVTSVTPSANNPQPKVGEVSVAGSQSSTSKSTVSTSQILSIVGGEQSRLSKLETSTASAAVEQAKSDSAKVTADAQTVAATQQAQTLSNAQAVIAAVSPTSQGGGFSGTGLQSQFNAGPTSIGLLQPTSTISVNVQRSTDLYSLISSGQAMSSMGLAVNSAAPTNTYTPKFDREETKTFDQVQLTEQKQSTSATGPLNNLTSMQQMPLQTMVPTVGPVVNKNVKDNDAAGGVSIAAIATQPQGFESYMASLRDSTFYAPKEIYRNQRVVDNARAQRLLNGASDRVHQQMVDMQYNNNKGN